MMEKKQFPFPEQSFGQDLDLATHSVEDGSQEE
jgi:hypothetical protein